MAQLSASFADEQQQPLIGNENADCPNVQEYLKRTASSHSQFLQFKLISRDGGEYSSEYTCANMLKQDSSVYCTTRKENTSVVLKLDERKNENASHFVMTHVIVKAPETGFTCPIGSGMVFVFNG